MVEESRAPSLWPPEVYQGRPCPCPGRGSAPWSRPPETSLGGAPFLLLMRCSGLAIRNAVTLPRDALDGNRLTLTGPRPGKSCSEGVPTPSAKRSSASPARAGTTSARPPLLPRPRSLGPDPRRQTVSLLREHHFLDRVHRRPLPGHFALLPGMRASSLDGNATISPPYRTRTVLYRVVRLRLRFPR